MKTYPIVKATGWSSVQAWAMGPYGGSCEIKREDLTVGMNLMPMMTDSDNGGWSNWGTLIVKAVCDDYVEFNLFSVKPLQTAHHERENVAPYEDGEVAARLVVDGLSITMPDESGVERTFTLDKDEVDIWQKAADHDPDALAYIITAVEQQLPDYPSVAAHWHEILEKQLMQKTWTHIAASLDVMNANVSNKKYADRYDVPLTIKDTAAFTLFPREYAEGMIFNCHHYRMFAIEADGSLRNAFDSTCSPVIDAMIADKADITDNSAKILINSPERHYVTLYTGDTVTEEWAEGDTTKRLTISLVQRPWKQIEITRKYCTFAAPLPFERVLLDRDAVSVGMQLPTFDGRHPSAVITAVDDISIEFEADGEKHKIYTDASVEYGRNPDRWSVRVRLLDEPLRYEIPIDEARQIVATADPEVSPMTMALAYAAIGDQYRGDGDLDRAARTYGNAKFYWRDADNRWIDYLRDLYEPCIRRAYDYRK